MRGRFRCKNPDKYKGDATQIIYRSRPEFRLMMYFDKSPNVIAWSSEEIVIPYRSPRDNKIHRYIPDFWVDIKGKGQFVYEYKPDIQTRPPTPKRRTTKRYLKEAMTYGVNQQKWKSAKAWCQEHNMTFKVITEKNLDGR